MAEEWRVSLVFDRRAGVRVGSRRKHVRDLLRSRLGREIRVSADENRVYLYGAAPWAAEEADQVAREVLAEQNLSAQVQVDYWNPAIGDWRNPDATPQDSPAPGKRRTDRTGLLRSVVDAIGEFFPF